jgi:hypothetical protein
MFLNDDIVVFENQGRVPRVAFRSGERFLIPCADSNADQRADASDVTTSHVKWTNRYSSRSRIRS